MNFAPDHEKKAKMTTFTKTMSELKRAVPRPPRTRMSVMVATIPTAKALNTTGTPKRWGALARTSGVRPAVRKSVTTHLGRSTPKPLKSPSAYADHEMATAVLPMAYSSNRSHPMIHATTSPRVAYAYVYALPAAGTMEANSA